MAIGKQPERGFTLLELMVIVTLIGLLSVMVMVNYMPKDTENTLSDSMERLKTQLRSVSQRAITDQQWYGIAFTQQAYQIMQFNKAGWHTLPNSPRQQLAPGLDIELESEGAPVRLEVKVDIPQIQASPDGLVSPFILRLSLANESQELTDPYAPAD